MTVEQITHHFLAHRNVTNELINKIEAGHYEYKPAPTSMSAFDLSTHILTSFYAFASVVKSGDLSPLGQKADFSGKSLSDLAAEYTKKTVDVLRSLSEDDLNKTIDATAAFGRKLSGRQLLQMAIDHEIHHKGNLYVYVREMGHTDLPLFVQFG